MWSGKFQSGCRAVTGDVKRLGGGYWRLEMRLGAGVGVWGCLWGRVRAGVLGGGGTTPPFKRFPGGGGGGGQSPQMLPLSWQLAASTDVSSFTQIH